MTNTHAFTARPVTRKSVDRWASSLSPKLREPSHFERTLRHSNFQYLLAVAECYRLHSKWNRGAEFLFSSLIHALDLGDHENEIVAAARPQRGRKQSREIAEFIQYERKQGKNILQIRASLKQRGIEKSPDAIRDYLKPPRKHRKQSKT